MTIQNPSSQKPLVSFILPCYNIPANMLCECIDSILALPLQSSERQIILVDDGSDESPLEQLGARAEELTYIRQKNSGLSVARNAGLRLCTGEYIQFVDTDDQLILSGYSQILELARTQQHDLIMFEFTTDAPSNLIPAEAPTRGLSQKGEATKAKEMQMEKNKMDDSGSISLTSDTPSTWRGKGEAGASYLRHHNLNAAAWGYLFKQSILGDLTFTPGIYHEDEEFTPRLLLHAESVCDTHVVAYLYRKRSQSITTDTHIKKRLKRINDTRDIILRLNTMADRMPVNERTALQRRVAQLTMDYIYKIIVETRNKHYLTRKLHELKAVGLFPLPDRDYTTKYKWFRRLSSTDLGLRMLLRILPAINKER
ncbi:MAG: glycosyltransferase [Prevotella sp.]|nr:glycosyltransferase [Prevotella sp.]